MNECVRSVNDLTKICFAQDETFEKFNMASLSKFPKTILNYEF